MTSLLGYIDSTCQRSQITKNLNIVLQNKNGHHLYMNICPSILKVMRFYVPKNKVKKQTVSITK